jgi:hypothetical protein
VWVGGKDAAQSLSPVPSLTEPTSPLSVELKPAPIAYTPTYLTEKIRTARSAVEGERKGVTVLFADIKDSTERIKDLNSPRRRSSIVSYDDQPLRSPAQSYRTSPRFREYFLRNDRPPRPA